MSTEPHRPSHMSPAQAAQVAGVSRWTIMRAIKSLDLLANRDNRNQWHIASDDLDAWRLHSVRSKAEPHTLHSLEVIAGLREKLSGETTRADAAERARDHAEADRDHWREIAGKLADRNRSRWPWRR